MLQTYCSCNFVPEQLPSPKSAAIFEGNVSDFFESFQTENLFLGLQIRNCRKILQLLGFLERKSDVFLKFWKIIRIPQGFSSSKSVNHFLVLKFEMEEKMFAIFGKDISAFWPQSRKLKSWMRPCSASSSGSRRRGLFFYPN